MRTSTSWACTAVLSAVAGGTFTHVSAGGQNPTPAPSPREKPTDEAWLPKPGSDPAAKRVVDLPADPPSAFPDLVPPVLPEGLKTTDEKYEKHQAMFAKACPRLYGVIVLKIEATDDMLRKLLKARLHQATFEFQLIDRVQWAISGPPRPGVDRYRDCLLDIQSTATELWSDQPKELVPWLEELIIASKELERFTRIRILTATRTPDELYAARRLRLKIEAELWKAKHPK